MDNVPPEAPSYPKSWRWDEDGDHVFGRFLSFDRGQTRGYGKKTIVVLQVGDEPRSVWLTNEALFGKFRDELQERPNRELQFEERIAITRHEPKESENGRMYRPFTVLFPDRPAVSTSTLFDLDVPEAPEAPDPPKAPESESEDAADDDIPF